MEPENTNKDRLLTSTENTNKSNGRKTLKNLLSHILMETAFFPYQNHFISKFKGDEQKINHEEILRKFTLAAFQKMP